MLQRITAFLIGVLGLASLRAQYDALLPPVADQPLLQQLWFLAGYFTILTNLLVTAHLLASAQGWRISASRAAGLVVAMVVVSVLYHTLLAALWQPQGLAWWADQGLHTAMPVATLAWWLAFAPKDVTARDLPAWLIYPALYAAYAVVRGRLTGFWAYPFLDMDQIGVVQFAVNSLAVMGLFVLVGMLLLAVARRLR